MVKNVFTTLGVLVCLLGSCSLSVGNMPDLCGNQVANCNWVVDKPTIALGVKKFFNSFTSYEFPNPFNAAQDPLSRLEFPIDQWFMGGSASYTAKWWDIYASAWVNLSRETSRQMQDSDWDDPINPNQKTIFSESNCRLNKGLLVDAGLTFKFPLLTLNGLKPCAGYRYDYYAFTTYDGYQTELGELPSDLPGDGIDFNQKFNQFYIGLKYKRQFNFSDWSAFFALVGVEIQGDYAVVTAINEDLHLLRAGNRITQDKTRGNAWHVGASVSIFQSDRFSLAFDGDFKRISTYGSHQLTNNVLFVDFSFEGARVWSDQLTLAAVGQVTF